MVIVHTMRWSAACAAHYDIARLTKEYIDDS